MRTAIILFLLVFAFPAAAQQVDGRDVDTEVAALLEQIGGRDVWAEARGFHMVEILHAAHFDLPAIREYWVDFEQPRIMEKTTTNAIHGLQALNLDQGWTLRARDAGAGMLTEWDAQAVTGWRSFWPGIPTRVFHLLASNDPSVEARALHDHRLDIFVDGTFAVWIAMDANARPVAYGRSESHTETHFLGAYETYGPVELWSTAYEPGDEWAVTMVDYTLYTEEMPVSYDPPSNFSNFDPDDAS